MKVLMLVPDCFMIDRRVLQQARSLTRAGHQVTVLAGFECATPESYDDQGVAVHRFVYDWDDERLKRIRAKLPDNDRIRMLVNRGFMAVAKRLLPFSPFDMFVYGRAREFPADVVHIHDLPLLKHGARLAREWNVPLVFDSHEIYYEQESLPPRVQRRLKRQERRYVPQCRIFITVNEAIAEYFEKLHGVRPMVLLNAADPPPPGFDANSRADLRARADLPADATVVIYQGWISGERNLETLVRAAEHLPAGAWLVMIGYGAYEEHLRSVVAGQPWSDKVRFLGRIEPQDILAVTAGADLGVIPYQPIDLNHRLCSPNKFFEYIQTGVPVLAHELPFFQGMGRKYGVATTADLSRPQSMAAAINGLLADPAKRSAMRAACPAAAAELNWDTQAAKLVAAYEQLK